MCVNRNLFYNVNTYLAEKSSDNRAYRLSVDLSTPWTWLKRFSCKF